MIRSILYVHRLAILALMFFVPMYASAQGELSPEVETLIEEYPNILLFDWEFQAESDLFGTPLPEQQSYNYQVELFGEILLELWLFADFTPEDYPTITLWVFGKDLQLYVENIGDAPVQDLLQAPELLPGEGILLVIPSVGESPYISEPFQPSDAGVLPVHNYLGPDKPLKMIKSFYYHILKFQIEILLQEIEDSGSMEFEDDPFLPIGGIGELDGPGSSGSSSSGSNSTGGGGGGGAATMDGGYSSGSGGSGGGGGGHTWTSNPGATDYWYWYIWNIIRPPA